MSIAQLAAFLAAIKAEQDREFRRQQEQARLPAPELQYDRTTADRRSPYDDGGADNIGSLRDRSWHIREMAGPRVDVRYRG
jgi:hypothetical protein